MSYSKLDSHFPLDKYLESADWLERHGFVKQSSSRWMKTIFVGMLKNGAAQVCVNAYHNATSPDDLWFARVSKWVPKEYFKEDWFDSNKHHEDVRDCLLEVVDDIDKKKRELEELVKNEQNV